MGLEDALSEFKKAHSVTKLSGENRATAVDLAGKIEKQARVDAVELLVPWQSLMREYRHKTRMVTGVDWAQWMKNMTKAMKIKSRVTSKA